MHDAGSTSQHASPIDIDQVQQNRDYREQLARALLDRCPNDADHVELRRAAVRTFPELARTANGNVLAVIVGHAATMRVRNVPLDDRDVTDARLEMTATEPLAYPASYGEIDEELRATLVAFCERELEAGREGPEALSSLLRLHGWPYSERTFYVGPWKAARMRVRRRSDG